MLRKISDFFRFFIHFRKKKTLFIHEESIFKNIVNTKSIFWNVYRNVEKLKICFEKTIVFPSASFYFIFTRNNLYNIIPAAFVNARRNNRNNRRSAAPRGKSRPASRIASQTPPTRTRSRAWRSLENQ